MKTRRFFSDNPVQDGWTSISGDEFHHLTSVMRAHTDDTIEIVDGAGTLIIGKIRRINKKEAKIHILNQEREGEKPVKLIVAPAVLKKKSMGLMIEKLSEMGIDEIRPINFIRNDEPYSPALLKKWQKIAQQSLKVNKKLWVSRIFPPVNLETIIQFSQNIKTRILLDIEGEDKLPNKLAQPIISIIGPPGDFTRDERQMFLKSDFIPLRITSAILKSETAAISITAILSHALNPSPS